jgi:hypothetical protein
VTHISRLPLSELALLRPSFLLSNLTTIPTLPSPSSPTMPIATSPPLTDIAPGDMTGDQLALASSEAVFAQTRYGNITGGRVRNGCQVFLSEHGQSALRARLTVAQTSPTVRTCFDGWTQRLWQTTIVILIRSILWTVSTAPSPVGRTHCKVCTVTPATLSLRTVNFHADPP